MLSRDHYATLGVAPDASEEEIDEAYRHLCRRYHPDLNPGDAQAAAAFERIENAYAVLGDPQRRARYDREGRPDVEDEAATPAPDQLTVETGERTHGGSFGELFRALRDHRRRTRARRGNELQASVSVPLAQAERGRHTTVTVRRLVPCEACGGSGRVDSRRARPCQRCNGEGKEVFGKGALSVTVPCSDCRGDGLRYGEDCERCRGSGLTASPRAVAVHVPPGVTDGQLVRIPGGGHHGSHGGPPGDLLVTCRVEPHPFFGRQGPNLTCRVPISIGEAILGGRVKIPTLEGPAATLRIPPGTANGAQLRLRERGLATPDGRRGDILVTVEVWVPPVRDEDTKSLIRELERRTPKPSRRFEERATVQRR